MDELPFYATTQPGPTPLPVAVTQPVTQPFGGGGPVGFDPRAVALSARTERAATVTSPARRFGKSDVSFGLTGRIVGTVLLLLPMAWFVYAAQWILVSAGTLVYAFVILPMCLRDLWRARRR